LIKNLFDLKNCIFVLAIDYGVVVKGLQSKFGKMTEENEWEFRAFFDKIIQLPFSMPISSYNISKYLQNLLVKVKYFDKDDLKDEKTINHISKIVDLSVGTNPRTLKRLANSVSLIEIIRGDLPVTKEERVIEFALICIQITYPFIYSLIMREPDFTSWDDRVVYSVVKNKKIDIKDLEVLKETDEFDADWEQNLWKICQVSTFLKERAFSLSRLLNFIKENIPDVQDEELNDTIERLLSMSSVTSVSVDSVVKKEKQKRIRYAGWEEYEKVLAERRMPDKIIYYTKTIIEYINSLFDKNDITITYAPRSINFKNPHAKSRKKVFIWITIQKRKVILGMFANNEEAISNLGKKYPKAIDNKNGWVDLTLNDQNISTIDNYKELIVLAYRGMETN
jgi:predicted house-cleaning noncanonical NTP pyrophosphatase (MazG superfamily)